MLTLTPTILLTILVLYFILLIIIAYLTSRGADNESFFVANRDQKWYVVAFGMIGTTISGVTFISVPGNVGMPNILRPNLVAGGSLANSQYSFMQVALGYLVGYFVVGTILLPLYYRLQVTSIYTYLEHRLGTLSHRTGAAFFLLSRSIGAAFRLFLVAIVLQKFIFEAWGVPFPVTVFAIIGFILLYTYKGGVKTIIWTDTIQSIFMLLSVVITVWAITNELNLSVSEVPATLHKAGLDKMFFFENGWSDPNNFWKQFLSGIFIVIAMTGLDQDLMQKNLTCKTLGDAQKNMFSFVIVYTVMNFLFLTIGALLAVYAMQKGITVERSDYLYPTLALQHLSPLLGITFFIGIIAAAYASADSALASLTTSFCIDFLKLDKLEDTNSNYATRSRGIVHISFSVLLFFLILLFWYINDESVINQLFKIAGLTYGPLLGLFSFGLMTKRNVKDTLVPFVCIASPLICWYLNANSVELLGGYKFGFELLLLNGFLTFIGLLLVSSSSSKNIATN